MEERCSTNLGSYFNIQHNLHVVDGAASSATAGKEVLPASFFSAAVDTNPFAFPQVVSARPSSARPTAAATIAAEFAKRKRGRPRKYGARSSLHSFCPLSGVAGASPSLMQESPTSSSRKKETKSSNSSARKAQLTALGNAGQGFTPHVITVSAGEDLVNKLVSMMQQGKRAVCVLSATGSILNPSFRQPALSSFNDTYDGMFDIVSLSGALTYTKDGGTVSRTGGLGICLSGVDGRIVGGGVEGPLMAAGPVQVLHSLYPAILTIFFYEKLNPAIKQVIAGSFLIDIDRNFSASTKEDDCTNKQSTEAAARTTFPPPIHVESNVGSFRGVTPSRGSEDYQRMGESYHLFPSRPLFPLPDWDGPANP